MVKRYIDSSEPYKSEIVQPNNDLFDTFYGGHRHSFNKSRTMIDILFLSIMIITEKITPTNYKDKSVLDEKFESILKLQTKKFIIIENIKAAELIPCEKQYLSLIDWMYSHEIFPYRQRRSLCLWMRYKLIRTGLIDDCRGG